MNQIENSKTLVKILTHDDDLNSPSLAISIDLKSFNKTQNKLKLEFEELILNNLIGMSQVNYKIIHCGLDLPCFSRNYLNLWKSFDETLKTKDGFVSCQ